MSKAQESEVNAFFDFINKAVEMPMLTSEEKREQARADVAHRHFVNAQQIAAAEANIRKFIEKPKDAKKLKDFLDKLDKYDVASGQGKGKRKKKTRRKKGGMRPLLSRRKKTRRRRR